MFDLCVDVLNHHDGIVNDKPDRKDYGKECQDVDCEAARYMTKKVPIRATGIATTGMRVVLELRRKRKITSTTSRKAIKMVCSTSFIDFRI